MTTNDDTVKKHFEHVLPGVFAEHKNALAMCPICLKDLSDATSGFRIITVPHLIAGTDKGHIFGYTICFYCEEHDPNEVYLVFLSMVGTQIVGEMLEISLDKESNKLKEKTDAMLHTIKDFKN